MSINTYEKTGQIFFNLCQASVIGAAAMMRTNEIFWSIHASIWLIASVPLLYVTGWHFTDKASRLKRQENKVKGYKHKITTHNK